jgi:hypothetical protein
MHLVGRDSSSRSPLVEDCDDGVYCTTAICCVSQVGNRSSMCRHHQTSNLSKWSIFIHRIIAIWKCSESMRPIPFLSINRSLLEQNMKGVWIYSSSSHGGLIKIIKVLIKRRDKWNWSCSQPGESSSTKWLANREITTSYPRHPSIRIPCTTSSTSY